MQSLDKSKKLRNIFILILVVMLTIGLSSGFGSAATYQIFPTADASVYSSASVANVNFGTDYVILVYIAGSTNNLYAYSYLKFDLSSIPSTENITDVILYVYCWTTTPTIPTIQLRPVADTTWLETGITWNNKPSYGDLIVSTLGTVGWKQWGIPVAQLPDTGLVSFMLMTQTAGTSQFYSKEYATATLRPYL